MSCVTIPHFVMREGTNDELGFLESLDGSPVPLDTFTNISLHLVRPSPNLDLDIAHTPIDLPGGSYKIMFSPTDLVAGNGQRAYIDYTDSGGSKTTSEDFFIDVAPR